MTADITPGRDTLYRVWLNGREVCATNSGSLAMWALLEAKRWAARTFAPANDGDDHAPTDPAAGAAVPQIMEAA